MAVAAGVGLFEFPFSAAAPFWRWVDLCEASGIDSIWQSDRLITDTPMLESMSTMAALAGATKRIKFGMNVISLGLRDPVLLAKQCATIDVLSEGRLLPAFGIGNIRSADWTATGTPTKGRGKRSDEALDIVTALWRGDKLSYAGDFFTLEGARILPLPVQRKFPLWIGGSSKAAIARTARIGTGWVGGRETPSEVTTVVAGIKEAARIAGRHIADDHYGASFAFRFGRPTDDAVGQFVATAKARFPERDPMASLAVGTVEDIMMRLEEYVTAGATKFVLRPVAIGDDDVYAQTRALAEKLLPEIAAFNARSG